MPEGMIAGAVLAAGEGRRFGAAKQLALLDGRPLLEHALAASASAAAGLARRYLVLGARADEIAGAIDRHGHEIVICRDWQEGMAASLRAAVGAAAADGAAALIVTLGDQPGVGAPAIARVIAARSESKAPAIRASYDGVPGHPVLIDRDLFESVLALRGEHGARALLASAGAELVPCEDVAVAGDVDLPADLEALRRRRSAASARTGSAAAS